MPARVVYSLPCRTKRARRAPRALRITYALRPGGRDEGYLSGRASDHLRHPPRLLRVARQERKTGQREGVARTGETRHHAIDAAWPASGCRLRGFLECTTSWQGSTCGLGRSGRYVDYLSVSAAT